MDEGSASLNPYKVGQYYYDYNNNNRYDTGEEDFGDLAVGDNGRMMPFRGMLEFYYGTWVEQLDEIKSNGKSQAFYTLLHEIGHILGIGICWETDYHNLTHYANGSKWYTGQFANKEYKAIVDPDGSRNISLLPIENDGGAGTADGHPEEGHAHGVSLNNRRYDSKVHPGLEHELMTGWAESSNIPEPLSRVTVGFLEDLGYTVDYSAADYYSLPQDYVYYVTTNGNSYEFYTDNMLSNRVAKTGTHDNTIFVNVHDRITLYFTNFNSLLPFIISKVMTGGRTTGKVQFVMETNKYEYSCVNKSSMNGYFMTKEEYKRLNYYKNKINGKSE